MGAKKFSEDIDSSAKKLMESRKQKTTFWQFANVLGVGGWVFVIPVVGGAYLGRYLDKKFGNEGISWTITFIIIGIAAGTYNIWRFFLKKSNQ